MTRSSPLLLLFLYALVLKPAAALAAPHPTTIEGSVRWSGEIRLTEPVVVPRGAELTLEPGTLLVFSVGAGFQVQGSLSAAGTELLPIRFQGDKASEAPLVMVGDPPARVALSHSHLSGAKSGLEVLGGSLTLSSVQVTDCGSGTALRLKGHAELTDVTFHNNDLGLAVENGSTCQARQLTLSGNRVGIGVSNGSELVLEKTRFSGNEVGYSQSNACNTQLKHCRWEGNQTAVALQHTRRSPRISFGTFTDNERAVVARLFSHVYIEATTFSANRSAVDAYGFCGLFLRYNAFTKNGQAIRLDKKSNAGIDANLLEANEVALFADFSTYPQITGNLFTGNQWHVRLGLQQSADFEQKRGSAGLTMDTARDAKTRNPMLLAGDLPSGEGIFSVAGNAWDEETAAELAKGTETNVARFWDGRDQAPVAYEGFGPDTYRVDVIRFAPTVPAATTAVGPAAWKPFDDAAPQPGPSETLQLQKP